MIPGKPGPTSDSTSTTPGILPSIGGRSGTMIRSSAIRGIGISTGRGTAVGMIPTTIPLTAPGTIGRTPPMPDIIPATIRTTSRTWSMTALCRAGKRATAGLAMFAAALRERTGP